MDLDQIKWASESVETNNIILDVRTPEEFSEGYIANATNLNIYDANTFMSKIQSYNKENCYYLYCKSGARSAQACQIMSQLGFNNVYNLLGGITNWKGEISK
ncbi:rhodanese-like domain-containing protein [Flavobacteriaceae bacterium]|nr:rhodanese-like domain-containing protein [Flavobacteriaceae bacterium]